MLTSATVSTPQVGTVVLDGMVYVTTAYDLPTPPDTSQRTPNANALRPSPLSSGNWGSTQNVCERCSGLQAVPSAGTSNARGTPKTTLVT